MNEITPLTATPREVAVSPKKKTIRDHLESPAFLEQIAKALPRHMKAERMTRIAITAMTRTPALMDCTPESFCKCMLDLSALGLEPDGRRAHLIPFRDNRSGTTVCTLIVDYKGLAELAYNSGVVSYLHADVIREGDLFQFSKGELREHIPWFLRRDADRPSESGPVFAAYALARLKDGGEKVDVLSLEELNAIRDASQGYRMAKTYGKPSPWTTNEAEMMKKTAFRRLSKWLPLSPEIRDRLDVEDDEETRFASAKPARAEVSLPKFLSAPDPKPEPALPDDNTMPEPPPLAEPVPRTTRRMTREQVTVNVQPVLPSPPAPPSPIQRLSAVLGKINAPEGFTAFKSWCAQQDCFGAAWNWTAIDDVPADICERLLAGEELAAFAATHGGVK